MAAAGAPCSLLGPDRTPPAARQRQTADYSTARVGRGNSAHDVLEIQSNYKQNTGKTITTETLRTMSPLETPAVLVACHAPFTWGLTVEEAVENAVVLENVARLATETLQSSIFNSSGATRETALPSPCGPNFQSNLQDRF